MINCICLEFKIIFCFSDYSLSNVVIKPIKNISLVEISYYLHSLYAIFVVDDRKKDFKVMAAHHVITFALLLIVSLAK